MSQVESLKTDVEKLNERVKEKEEEVASLKKEVCKCSLDRIHVLISISIVTYIGQYLSCGYQFLSDIR